MDDGLGILGVQAADKFLRQERLKFTVDCLMRNFKSWQCTQSVLHSPEKIATPDPCAITAISMRSEIVSSAGTDTDPNMTTNAAERFYSGKSKIFTENWGDKETAVERVQTKLLNKEPNRLHDSRSLQNCNLKKEIVHCLNVDDASQVDCARFAGGPQEFQQKSVSIDQADQELEYNDSHRSSFCYELSSAAEAGKDKCKAAGTPTSEHPTTSRTLDASANSNPLMENKGIAVQSNLSQFNDQIELLSSTYLSRKAARGASARENKKAIVSQQAVARLADIEEKKKAGLAVAEVFAASEARKVELRQLRKSKAAMLKAQKRQSNREMPEIHDGRVSTSEGTTGINYCDSVDLKFAAACSAQISDVTHDVGIVCNMVPTGCSLVPAEVEVTPEGKAESHFIPVKIADDLNAKSKVDCEIAAPVQSKEAQFSEKTGLGYEAGKLGLENSDDMSRDGRIVWNHSTHLRGLIKVLQKLQSAHTCIKTIVPGRISTGLAHRPTLQLEEYVALQAPVCGFTCFARIESSRQEVMFVTEEGTCIASIISAVQDSCSNGFRCGGQNQSTAASSYEMGFANQNRDWSKEDERKRKDRQKAKHAHEKEAHRHAVDLKNAEERKRKLKASGAVKEKNFNLDAAAAAKEWANAATHGVRGEGGQSHQFFLRFAIWERMLRRLLIQARALNISIFPSPNI